MSETVKHGSGKSVSWDDIRFFLEVARAGSMNGAAKRLNVDHTTVGRRVKAFEGRAGTELFERKDNRLSLTADGELALKDAQRMEDTVHSMMRNLSGGSANLKGEVKVNVTEGLATYWLMPRMNDFQRANPDLRINWSVTTNNLSTIGSEVDIAVGWHEPDRPNIIRQKIGSVKYSLFAFPAYFERYGTPQSWADLKNHNFLQYNAYKNHPAFSQWNAFLEEVPPATYLENVGATHAIISNGELMALLPDYAGLIAPDLVRAPLEMNIIIDMLLAYHEESRQVARVRAVVDEVQRLAGADRQNWFSD